MPEPPTTHSADSAEDRPSRTHPHNKTKVAPADLPGLCSCQFSFEKYQRFLNDESLSEDQQRQLLETLWKILIQMVDLNIPIHTPSDIFQHQEKERSGGQKQKSKQHERTQV